MYFTTTIRIFRCSPFTLASSTGNAQAKPKGAELEFEAHPISGFVLSGGGAFLESKYTNYPRPVGYPLSPLDPPVNLINAEGKDTAHAPRWTTHATAGYTLSTSVGDFNA